MGRREAEIERERQSIKKGAGRLKKRLGRRRRRRNTARSTEMEKQKHECSESADNHMNKDPKLNFLGREARKRRRGSIGCYCERKLK